MQIRINNGFKLQGGLNNFVRCQFADFRSFVDEMTIYREL
jgi:hypothetical protein